MTDFDLTYAYFALSSDEGPLHGDPVSLEGWALLANALRRRLVRPN